MVLVFYEWLIHKHARTSLIDLLTHTCTWNSSINRTLGAIYIYLWSDSFSHSRARARGIGKSFWRKCMTMVKVMIVNDDDDDGSARSVVWWLERGCDDRQMIVTSILQNPFWINWQSSYIVRRALQWILRGILLVFRCHTDEWWEIIYFYDCLLWFELANIWKKVKYNQCAAE